MPRATALPYEPRVGPLPRGAPDPVTKLTDRRIAYLIRQARAGFRTDSLGQMAARWGVRRRRLNQVLRLSRVLGGTPLLKTTRRPPQPPLTVPQTAEIERQRTHRGATKLYQGLLGVSPKGSRDGRHTRHQRGWLRWAPRSRGRARCWAHPNR